MSKALGLDAVIAILHRDIDMADERKNKLTIPVHRDTLYEALNLLHTLKEAKNA